MLTLDIPQKAFLYEFINPNILGVKYRAPITEHQVCTVMGLKGVTHFSHSMRYSYTLPSESTKHFFLQHAFCDPDFLVVQK